MYTKLFDRSICCSLEAHGARYTSTLGKCRFMSMCTLMESSYYKTLILTDASIKSFEKNTWPRSGLQLRKSEQNGFHSNFLISQPNPMI